jgi:CHAD domain-containing protein
MAHATTQIREALATSLAHQRELFVACLPSAVSGDVRALHLTRVASRRLREALALAEVAGVCRDAARVRRAVRRVTRALGPVRELDVALAELDRVAARYAWAPGASAAIRRSLEQTRAARRRAMRRRLAGTGRGALRARLVRVADGAADDRVAEDVRRAVADRLARRANRVLEHAVACGTLYSVDRLHALRIAVKQLRYTLEIAETGAGSAAGPILGALKSAQQRLGRLHDAQVLLDIMQTMDADVLAGGDWDWHAMVDDLERDCRERHAGIVRQLPGLMEAVHTLKRDAIVTLHTGRRKMARATVPARANRSPTGRRRPLGRSA